MGEVTRAPKVSKGMAVDEAGRNDCDDREGMRKGQKMGNATRGRAPVLT